MNKLINSVKKFCGKPTQTTKDFIIWKQVNNVGIFPSVFDKIIISKKSKQIYTYTKYFITRTEADAVEKINKNIKYNNQTNCIIITSNNFIKNINLLCIAINSCDNSMILSNDIKVKYVKIMQSLLQNYRSADVMEFRREKYYTFLIEYKNIIVEDLQEREGMRDPWYASSDPYEYDMNFQKNSGVFEDDNFIFKTKTQCDNVAHTNCYCCPKETPDFEKNIYQMPQYEQMTDRPYYAKNWYTSNDPLDIALGSKYLNNDYNIHQGSQLAQTDRLKSLYYYDSADKTYSDDKKFFSFVDKKIKSEENFKNSNSKTSKDSSGNTVTKFNESEPRTNVSDIRYTLATADRYQNLGSKIDLGKRYYGSKAEKRNYPKISEILNI